MGIVLLLLMWMRFLTALNSELWSRFSSSSAPLTLWTFQFRTWKSLRKFIVFLVKEYSNELVDQNVDSVAVELVPQE